MMEIRNIIQRFRDGQSKRHINRELGVHRSILRKLHALAVAHQWLHPGSPMPDDATLALAWNTSGNADSGHTLDPFKEQIEAWHQQGYSSVVIQRLLNERGCEVDVQVVRRYRRGRFPKSIQPVMVRPTEPGQYLEIDFGELGRFLNERGEVKRVWIFSLRLRHSRKAWREVVTDQKLSTFLMGHVRAFEYFNGVPNICVLDNLKAGVIKSTVDNDLLNPSYQAFAEHYGFIISPCPPRTPNLKGGVEGDIKYVKGNFLPWFIENQKKLGIAIPSIADLIVALEKWTREVDDVRIIQGVRRSPQDIFQSEEQKMLKPLPQQRWEAYAWAQCTVRRDWRFMYDSAWYSVPYRLIGKQVEVCATSTLIRVFHENQEVALHERATDKWEYKRKAEHAPPEQEAVLQSSRAGLLIIAEQTGPSTHRLVKAILAHPSVDKLKPVRYLLRLAAKYSHERLEKACQRAFDCRLFTYRSVREILEKGLDALSLEPATKNNIVEDTSYRFGRNLDEYKSAAFSRRETFNERIERLYPHSQYGCAMAGSYQGRLAEQTMEEHLKECATTNFTGVC